jgi:hypothetical protein
MHPFLAVRIEDRGWCDFVRCAGGYHVPLLRPDALLERAARGEGPRPQRPAPVRRVRRKGEL